MAIFHNLEIRDVFNVFLLARLSVAMAMDMISFGVSGPPAYDACSSPHAYAASLMRLTNQSLSSYNHYRVGISRKLEILVNVTII
jgi:hypothetical protein